MERARAIERMRGICSRKECCRQEIAAKLEKLEVEDVAGAVEQLCKEGFIDERLSRRLTPKRLQPSWNPFCGPNCGLSERRRTPPPAGQRCSATPSDADTVTIK